MAQTAMTVRMDNQQKAQFDMTIALYRYQA